jgi:hypothetical protein
MQRSLNPSRSLVGLRVTVCPFEFKQLNDVARWIFKQNCPARTAITDLPAERRVGRAQPIEQGIQRRGNDHEPIPPAWLRITAGLTTASRTWGAEIQRKVIAKQRCELAGIVHFDLKSEFVSVKLDRLVYISNDIADGRHSTFSSWLVRDYQHASGLPQAPD